MWYQDDKNQHVIKSALSLCLLVFVCPAIANPTGGHVVAGGANIRYGSNTVVTQTTNKTIVNWSSFSIGPHESTQFVQPSANSVILNRVTGNNASEIMGSLSSNGQVFLVNPNGIIFGKSANVNVGGLVASTANISNKDFMMGRYHFTGAPVNSKIINEGTITIRDAGLGALVAPNVQNSGTIHAQLGRVVLAAGSAFTIDLYGDNLITFDATSIANKNVVDNLGRIEAAGGTVMLTAAAADSVVENVVNMSGYISATTVNQHAGRIILQGYGNTNINVSGTLDVSGGTSGNAGEIHVLAMDGTTQVSGHLLAMGGALSGNGGFIETSGLNLITTSAIVDTSAAHGKTGTWLLDPTDINISDAIAASYSATLASTNLTIQASNDINFNNTATPVGWSTDNSFTVLAGHDINFNTGASTAINTTGLGTITLYSDYNNTGSGAVNFVGVPAFTNTVNAPGAVVNIFYNPSSYATPTVFDFVNSPSVTGYMLVHTGADLQNIQSNTGGSYALGGNISSGLSNFTPITFFSGKFYGQGYTISNLTINLPTTDHVGLFSDADVSNISSFSLINSTIIGRNNVGAIVGITTGFPSDPPLGAVLSNIYVNATVSGNNSVGGVVGNLGLGGNLSNILFYGTVSGADSVGGLVGSITNVSGATVNRSLAIATISGGTNLGGAVGNNTTGNQKLNDVYSSASTFLGPAVGNGVSTGGTALPALSLTTLPANFNSDGNFWQTNGSTNYISLTMCGSSCVIPNGTATSGLGNAAAQYVTVEQILNNNVLSTTPTLTYYSDGSLMYGTPLPTGDSIYVLTVTPETPAETQTSIEGAIDALKSAYGCNTSI